MIEEGTGGGRGFALGEVIREQNQEGEREAEEIEVAEERLPETHGEAEKPIENTWIALQHPIEQWVEEKKFTREQNPEDQVDQSIIEKTQPVKQDSGITQRVAKRGSDEGHNPEIRSDDKAVLRNIPSQQLAPERRTDEQEFLNDVGIIIVLDQIKRESRPNKEQPDHHPADEDEIVIAAAFLEGESRDN